MENPKNVVAAVLMVIVFGGVIANICLMQWWVFMHNPYHLC